MSYGFLEMRGRYVDGRGCGRRVPFNRRAYSCHGLLIEGYVSLHDENVGRCVELTATGAADVAIAKARVAKRAEYWNCIMIMRMKTRVKAGSPWAGR